MIDKKAKPAIKAMASAKAGSAAASKPNTIKARVATTTAKSMVEKTAVKKPMAKEAVVAMAEPEKNKAPAVKKVTATVFEKKASAKIADTNAIPSATQKTMAKPTPEERYRMVETAAYFIAEQRRFQGHSDEHWAAAEHKLGL